MPDYGPFYVERISRRVTTVVVRAKTAAEAKRMVEAGEYDELDSRYELKGFGAVARERRPGDAA